MGLFDSIPTHMDYCGQKLAEQLFQVFSVTFGVIGFIVGYIFQQFSYTMIILGVGCAIGCLVSLPPWPIYRRNHIKWQKPKEETKEPQQYSLATKSSGKSKKQR